MNCFKQQVFLFILASNKNPPWNIKKHSTRTTMENVFNVRIPFLFHSEQTASLFLFLGDSFSVVTLLGDWNQYYKGRKI